MSKTRENLTELQQRVINLATYDLYWGPVDFDDDDNDEDFEALAKLGIVCRESSAFYFGAALDYLRDIDLPDTLYYYPEWGGLSDTEPEGYMASDAGMLEDGEEDYFIEPEEYFTVDAGDIRDAIFGEELTKYF